MKKLYMMFVFLLLMQHLQVYTMEQSLILKEKDEVSDFLGSKDTHNHLEAAAYLWRHYQENHQANSDTKLSQLLFNFTHSFAASAYSSGYESTILLNAVLQHQVAIGQSVNRYQSNDLKNVCGALASERYVPVRLTLRPEAIHHVTNEERAGKELSEFLEVQHKIGVHKNSQISMPSAAIMPKNELYPLNAPFMNGIYKNAYKHPLADILFSLPTRSDASKNKEHEFYITLQKQAEQGSSQAACLGAVLEFCSYTPQQIIEKEAIQRKTALYWLKLYIKNSGGKNMSDLTILDLVASKKLITNCKEDLEFLYKMALGGLGVKPELKKVATQYAYKLLDKYGDIAFFSSEDFLRCLGLAQENVALREKMFEKLEEICADNYYPGIGGANAEALGTFIAKNYKGKSSVVHLIGNKIYEKLYNLSQGTLTVEMYFDTASAINGESRDAYLAVLRKIIVAVDDQFLMQSPECKHDLQRYFTLLEQEADKDADWAYQCAQYMKHGIAGLVEKNPVDAYKYIFLAAYQKHPRALKDFYKEPLHSDAFLAALRYAEQHASFCNLIMDAIERGSKKYYPGIGGANAEALRAFIAKNYKGKNSIVHLIGDMVYEQLFALSNEQLTPELYMLPCNKNNKAKYLPVIGAMLLALVDKQRDFIEQNPFCKKTLEKYINFLKQEAENNAEAAYAWSQCLEEGIPGLVAEDPTDYMVYLAKACCKEHIKALKCFVEYAENYMEPNNPLLRTVYASFGSKPKKDLFVYWARLHWMQLQDAPDHEKCQKLEPFAQQLITQGNKALNKTIGEVQAVIGDYYFSCIDQCEPEKKDKIIKKAEQAFAVGTTYNNTECYFGLGCTLLDFFPSKKHYEKGLQYLQRAADAGHKEAQQSIGGLKLFGPVPLCVLSILFVPCYAKGYGMLYDADKDHLMLQRLEKPLVMTDKQFEELKQLSRSDDDAFLLGVCAFDIGKFDTADGYFKQCDEKKYPQLCFYKGYCKLMQGGANANKAIYAEVCSLLVQALALDNSVFGEKADLYKKYAMMTLFHENFTECPDAAVAAMKFIVEEETYHEKPDWRMVLGAALKRFFEQSKKYDSSGTATEAVYKLYSPLCAIAKEYQDENLNTLLQLVHTLAQKVNAQNVDNQKQQNAAAQEKLQKITVNLGLELAGVALKAAQKATAQDINNRVSICLIAKKALLQALESCNDMSESSTMEILKQGARVYRIFKRLAREHMATCGQDIDGYCTEINTITKQKCLGCFIYNDQNDSIAFGELDDL